LLSGTFSPTGRRWGCGGSGAGRSALPGCGRRGFHIFAFLRQDGDELIDRHVIGAFRHHDFRHHAVIDGLILHRRLVGLDFGDHIAGLDRVALFLMPLCEVALLHRGRERRHEDVDGHGAKFSPKISAVADGFRRLDDFGDRGQRKFSRFAA